MPQNAHGDGTQGDMRDDPVSSSCSSLVETLYKDSGAPEWHLTLEEFRVALERSTRKALKRPEASVQRVEEYLRALHVRDLALALACAAGREPAWEEFVATYRGYLRAAAAAILRRAAESPAVKEFADSLFAELYGVNEKKASDRSLFRYFHGRSPLKTWLRAVLAQRHIDSIRAARRHVDLDDQEVKLAREKPALAIPRQPPDPHRERYIELFRRSLLTAIAGLERIDLERLRCYYAEEQTLAAIGRKLGEHESSVSRNLDRARRELRAKVEALLRAGFPVVNGSAAQPGLGDAEIALCFTYAAEDLPIDLDQLLRPVTSKGESSPKVTKSAEKATDLS